jgi:hypothetical protein
MAQLTREQEESVLRYLGARMQGDNVNTKDVRAVLSWIINNPLPSIEEMEAEAAQQVIDERAAKIAKHREALARLEAEE